MALPRWSRIFLGLFCAVALEDLVAELVGAQLASGIALDLLMPLLIAFVLTARRGIDPVRRSRLIRLTLAAQLFSWFGDSLGFAFLVKVGFFLVAQICYVIAFWPWRRSSVLWRPLAAAGYLVPIAVLIVIVARAAGALAIPVVVYGISLALMATLSTGLNRVTAVGGAVFVISDVILALATFRPSYAPPYDSFWNMLTYSTAQGLLAYGVLRQAGSAVVGPSPSTERVA